MPRRRSSSSTPPDDFLRAWGGPGPGFEWPASEHGIYVDPKGFVWIGGNGDIRSSDSQIHEGGHVRDADRPSRSEPRQCRYAESQAAGRHLRACGDERVVRRRRLRQSTRDCVRCGFGGVQADVGRVWQRAHRRTAEPGAPDADPNGAPQFVQPVHATRVSSDGLVYVSDRGGKRVQVFRLDGTYLSQVFIGRDCRAPACGNGTTAASTAFSTDAAQRFLFVGNRSQAKVMVLDRATLRVLNEFGSWGSEPGQFGTLHHMAADSNGNLYVTEVTPLTPRNRRVQKFRTRRSLTCRVATCRIDIDL